MSCFSSLTFERMRQELGGEHHELSLIQFERGIPAIIDELAEITERKPLNTQECGYIYLGFESVLRKCVREREAEIAVVELLESFGIRGEEVFWQQEEEKSSAIYERIKKLTVEKYGLEEYYAEKILWEALRDLRWNNEPKR